MTVSYGAQCISILIISYLLHITMHFDNSVARATVVQCVQTFVLMLSHHFLQICGNWPTPCIIAKAVRYGYIPRFFSTLDELREDSDEKLFFSARYNPFHVLHRLLPQSKNVSYNLRQRTHNLTLPTDVNAVMKQNFVYRMLFTDIC